MLNDLPLPVQRFIRIAWALGVLALLALLVVVMFLHSGPFTSGQLPKCNPAAYHGVGSFDCYR
jgi:hypothetical protein